jgi:hypothetical protein
VLTEESKAQILHYILHPVDRPPGMREQVQAVLFQHFGVEAHDDPFGPVAPGRRGYHWNFCFDTQGRLVLSPPAQTPYETVRGYHVISIAVSRCGPYVTAESYAVIPSETFASGIAFAQERPVSPMAVELAQEVGRRFGLTYLDAAELYAWELEDNVADEAGVDVWDDGWAAPNAFILLF